jgi:hypothetical protein
MQETYSYFAGYLIVEGNWHEKVSDLFNVHLLSY